MSFAQGFTSGFNMVDSALKRRDDTEFQKQQAALENVRYEKKIGTEAQYHKEGLDAQARQEATQAAYRKEDVAFRDTELKNQRDYQQGSLANARANTANDTARVGLAEKSQNWEMQTKDREIKRQESLARMQNVFAQDPATGAMNITVPQGYQRQFFEDAKAGMGLDLSEVAQQHDDFKNSVGLLKSALISGDPRHLNNPEVLKAINRVESKDINQGLSGDVKRKEIVGFEQHPQGLLPIVRSFDKDGNPIGKDAPVTVGRTSDGNDQLRFLQPQQLVQRVDGFDALSNILDANPDYKQFLANGATKKEGKESLEYEAKTVKNEDGSETIKVFNKRTGQLINPELAQIDAFNKTGDTQEGAPPPIKAGETIAPEVISKVTGKAVAQHANLVEESAKKHGIPSSWLYALMKQESGGNPNAKSNSDAHGLMQLIPDTAKRFGVKDIYDPKQNIEGSAKYLAFLNKEFKGDFSLIAAGYNAGEGAVTGGYKDKHGKYHAPHEPRVPNFKETKDYVLKTAANLRNIEAAQAKWWQLNGKDGEKGSLSDLALKSRINRGVSNQANEDEIEAQGGTLAQARGRLQMAGR